MTRSKMTLEGEHRRVLLTILFDIIQSWIKKKKSLRFKYNLNKIYFFYYFIRSLIYLHSFIYWLIFLVLAFTKIIDTCGEVTVHLTVSPE